MPPPPSPVAPLSAPPSPRVEITFEYTFDELRDGLTQSSEQQQQQKPRRAAAGLFGWALFVALAVLLFMLLNKRGTAAPPLASYRSPAKTVDAFVAVGPPVLVATLVGILVTVVAMAVFLMGENNQKVRESGKQLPTIGALLVILIGGIGAAILISRSEPGGWDVSYRQAMILALLPWIVVLALALALAVWLSRANLRRMWESKPYLRRRRTIVLDDEGERSADGLTDMFYRWPCFRRAWETASVLVLLDENDFRHILPKRVMDEATLAAARSAISNHVPDCQFLTTPGGFPVVPPAPPAAPSAHAAPPVPPPVR